MSDLVEFLLARIDYDEECARTLATKDRRPLLWIAGTVDHPARFLAECEAKRAIVELHTPVDHESVTVCSECGPDEDVRFRVQEYGLGWPCRTIRTLARVYNDHPDCREEWRS